MTLEKKAIGRSIPFTDWEMAAPKPTSEASVSTIQGRSGYGKAKDAAFMSSCCNLSKAASASSVH